MIDLKKYFDDNLEKYEYYNYKFEKYLYIFYVGDYKFYDDEEIIEEFKNLIYPYNPGDKQKDNDEKFVYIIFYLYANDYFIEEFPNYLKKPTDRWTLSYSMIRDKIIEKDGYTGVVSWQSRRQFINNLHILKRDNFQVTKDINDIIKKYPLVMLVLKKCQLMKN